MARNVSCDVNEEQPERLTCARVEADFLRTLGINVAAGRDFIADDDIPNAPRVALIRHGLWVRRYGADPRAVGRSINLNGQPVSIVGVLPEDFEFPLLGDADVLRPIQLRLPTPEQERIVRFVLAVGRLRAGVTVAEAEAALEPLLNRTIESVGSGLDSGAFARLRSLHDREVGDAALAARLLLGAVAVLLLIACVNVTSPILARLAARASSRCGRLWARGAVGSPGWR